jgi:hypothetical protein
MPRPKKKYSTTAPPPPVVIPTPAVLPYSFDLRAAAQYTGFSVWELRQAVTSGQLPTINRKPYVVRRGDLEAFLDQRAKVAA